MAKRPFRKMAKASVRRRDPDSPENMRAQLRKTLRTQNEVIRLAKQVSRVSDKADQELDRLSNWIAARQPQKPIAAGE